MRQASLADDYAEEMRGTNQDILTRAIEKAIAGGWRGDLLDIQVKAQDDGLVRVYWDDTEWSVLDIIFNHAFAKALWGDIEARTDYFGTNGDGHSFLPLWEFHLQQMVIAADPIAYLGEHL